MIPRGEVGIIVGLVGLSLQTITQEIYTIVLGMSIVTTLIAPPLIFLAFRKDKTLSHKIKSQVSKLKDEE